MCTSERKVVRLKDAVNKFLEFVESQCSHIFTMLFLSTGIVLYCRCDKLF